MRCVAITGIGVVSPFGLGTTPFWHALRAGRSGIQPITIIPVDGLNTQMAAEVRYFDPTQHFNKALLGTLDRFSQFALVAAREAIADSGLTLDSDAADRTATIIGTGVGGQTTQDENYWRVYGQNAKRLHPFTIPKLMVNAATSQVTMEFGLTGPAFSVSSACASSAHSIGLAMHMIRSGMVDRAVVGGSEACITFGTLKGWEALRVMAVDTCRPFSKNRTGMVLGEGAAIVVLEIAEVARARGARLYAELAGFGMSADARDLLQPSQGGAARAMRAALKDATMQPSEVSYINAHGTGTSANDVTETRAIREVFGDHADSLAVSSTKSMHGHTMGAAPALELAATVLAIRDNVAPPTINFSETDPACDLDYITGGARSLSIEAALSNAFAFGGLNAVLAVRRPSSWPPNFLREAETLL